MSGGAEFIIFCPEGVIGAEYRLVRIDEKSGRGEFSVSVQYVANTYFGISAPGIEAEKIAARTYRIKLPELKKGQYGFLAPGTIDADSAGTVHAFEVL